MWLFSYGSLVNEDTWQTVHEATPVKLDGWVRKWQHSISTPFGNVCGLTIDRQPNTVIDGILTYVNADNVTILDEREIGYERVSIEIADAKVDSDEVCTYLSKPSAFVWASKEYPILQTYIDCVAAGFFNRYGDQGMVDFFDTTLGWHLPILQDREKPIYPRALDLSSEFLRLVDKEMERVKARDSQKLDTT